MYSDCMIGVGAGVLTDCVAGTSVLTECVADAGVGAGMDVGVLTDCVAGAAVGAGVLRLRGGRGCRLYQVVRGVALGYNVVNVGAGVLTQQAGFSLLVLKHTVEFSLSVLSAGLLLYVDPTHT